MDVINMAKCNYKGCEKRLEGGVQMTCKFCGNKAYCTTHRLPEDHICNGLREMVRKARFELDRRLRSEATKVKKQNPKP